MKLLFATILLIASIALFYLPAGADEEQGGVEILVNPKVISISVPNVTLDYGSPQTGTTDNRPIPVGFDVTNTGNTSVDLQILGSETIGASTSSPGWQLGSSPGSDTYRHGYAVDIPSPAPGNFAALSTSAEDFKNNLVVGGQVNIKLNLDMPTTITTTEPQKATVTVIASEAN